MQADEIVKALRNIIKSCAARRDLSIFCCRAGNVRFWDAGARYQTPAG